jgi:hypothetical protein
MVSYSHRCLARVHGYLRKNSGQKRVTSREILMRTVIARSVRLLQQSTPHAGHTLNMKTLLAGAIAAALLSASPADAGPIVESLSIFNPDGSLFAFSGLDAQDNVVNHTTPGLIDSSLSTLGLQAFLDPGAMGIGPTIGNLNGMGAVGPGYTIIRDAQGNTVNAFGSESSTSSSVVDGFCSWAFGGKATQSQLNPVLTSTWGDRSTLWSRTRLECIAPTSS